MKGTKKRTAQLPDAFDKWAKTYFDKDYEAFISSLKNDPAVAVRNNPAKSSRLEFKGEPIPWCPEGLYLDERPFFALDPKWHGGAYYVQDASSMIIGHVVKQLSFRSNPVFLDMCGAPGGKATLLIDHLPDDGLLIANEVIRNRHAILAQNLIRWGDPRVFSSQLDPSFFSKKGMTFDLILVDAPCSGEGLFRKDPQAASHWSQDNVKHCSLRQSRILEDAAKCLKEGAYLIYSTCTFNEKENIEPLRNLLSKGQFESVPIDINSEWGVSEINSEGIKGYAFYPHKLRGEGFFFSIMKKENGEPQDQKKSKTQIRFVKTWPEIFLPETPGKVWQNGEDFVFLREESMESFSQITDMLRHIRPVAKLGKIKGKDVIPNHALAQMRNTSGIPNIEISLDEALQFLRKQPLALSGLPVGWHRLSYNGIGLGWIKGLKNRINNYYPSEYRLRKQAT